MQVTARGTGKKSKTRMRSHSTHLAINPLQSSATTYKTNPQFNKHAGHGAF